MRDRKILKKMLKSINEESRTSSERETNLNKTSKERGGFTKSDAPSTRSIGPSTKPSTTISSSVNFGPSVV